MIKRSIQIKKCQYCEKDYHPYTSRIKTSKYCCRTCQGKANHSRRWSVEVRRKMSLSHKGKIFSPETRLRISLSKRGSNNPMFGRPVSKEHRQKLSKTKLGKLNPMYGKRGELDPMYGKRLSEEAKMKIGEASSKRNKGEGNPAWLGGISFEPYSTDWTEDLKRAVRKRDRYTCQICGKEPAIFCHHIDYNKKNCSPQNLVTLCRLCHLKTNLHRDYWIDFFTKGFLKAEEIR